MRMAHFETFSSIIKIDWIETLSLDVFIFSFQTKLYSMLRSHHICHMFQLQLENSISIVLFKIRILIWHWSAKENI